MSTSCGIGAPREHLRSNVIRLMRCTRLRPIRCLDKVLASDARNGVFGAKLVTDLVEEWLNTDLRLAGLSRRLAAEGFAVITLKRRGRVAQAVSFYFARWSRVAYARDLGPLEGIDRAKVAYDYRQIDAMRRFFARQEELADRNA